MAELAMPGMIVGLECFIDEAIGAMEASDGALGGEIAHGEFMPEPIAAAWAGFIPYGTALVPAAMRADESARSAEYCMVAEVPYLRVWLAWTGRRRLSAGGCCRLS